MKYIKVLSFILISLISLFIALYADILFVNTTNSLPRGIYYNTFKSNIDKGDLVIACQSKEVAFFALKRGYVKEKFLSPCPLKAQTLLKPVVATSGDMIEINSKGVFVNNQPIPNSKPLAHILKNDLKPLHLKHKLTNKEFLLISSYNPYSWDGRYFGTTTANQIITVVKPLITFDKS